MSRCTSQTPPTTELAAAVETLCRADSRDIQSLGWHFQFRSFYSPLNDCAFLEANRDLWTIPSDPAAIAWDLPHQQSVLAEVAHFARELTDVPNCSTHRGEFAWQNQFWTNADAVVHYGLLRSRRPRHIVEIGCGWSSLLMARALARNDAHASVPTRVTQIEPYPDPATMSALPGHWTLHESILQRAPLQLFDTLEAGDVLFYDGSHVAKTASDVNWFFFRVLPRIKPGVLIHIHDIFFPYDYPETWTLESNVTWNEQYVLQAFLMFNDRFRVELCNSYLAAMAPGALESICTPLGLGTTGGSIWLKRTV